MMPRVIRVAPTITDPTLKGRSQAEVMLNDLGYDETQDEILNSQIKTKEETTAVEQAPPKSDNTILIIIFALVVIALIVIIVWMVMKQTTKPEDEIKKLIKPGATYLPPMLPHQPHQANHQPTHTQQSFNQQQPNIQPAYKQSPQPFNQQQHKKSLPTIVEEPINQHESDKHQSESTLNNTNKDRTDPALTDSDSADIDSTDNNLLKKVFQERLEEAAENSD